MDLRRFQSLRAAALLGLCAAASACAAEKTDEAELRLRLAPEETVRYAWSIESTKKSKSEDQGKPVDLQSDRTIKMTVVLNGAQPQKAGEVAARLKFEDLAIDECDRVDGKEKDRLKIGENQILYIEDGKTIIDSRNDVGLEKINEYQKRLRGLVTAEVRLGLDAAGRPGRVEGEPSLVETLKAGGSQGLFPILSDARQKPGTRWDDTFSLDSLLDLKLDKPATVHARMTFAKWVQMEGRPVAEIEVASAWENATLSGVDEKGARVTLSNLEGLGFGACRFDPAQGRYLEGQIRCRIKCRIEEDRKGRKVAFDVDGETTFQFEQLKLGPIGPAPAP